MGFFDRFKKKKEESIETPVVSDKAKSNELPVKIRYTTLPNGNLQFDFLDSNADFKKFYDTTRLVVGKEPISIGGKQVYNCAVSWYGDNDCQILDTKTGRSINSRAENYRGVLIEIDLELLQSDKNYYKMLMSKLLDKERVEEYLERGLQETPEIPCGKYIGGIRKTEKGYGKFFDVTVGQASHNSKLMVDRRQKLREEEEARRKRDIERKKEQINKLQSEIESMEI